MPQPMIPPSLGIEVLYSFVIILSCLIIYFSTKEIYEVSSYKGLKYFRQAFLFFAIALFFRSFIFFLLMFFNVSIVREIPRIFGFVTLFLFLYSSTIAILYLLYSIMWKKWNFNFIIYLFHIIAIIISFVGIITHEVLVLLGVQFLLFVFIAVISIISYSQKHKFIHLIYILLFVFWIFNIVDIFVPDFLRLFQIMIYLCSISLFFVILYKVLRKTG